MVVRVGAMTTRRKSGRAVASLMLLAAGVLLMSVGVWAQNGQPLVSEDTLKRVSEHVYALVGFPNIGIIVGNRATLVVDTGLGARNGATVVRDCTSIAGLAHPPKTRLAWCGTHALEA
jgi:hypothetical protein